MSVQAEGSVRCGRSARRVIRQTRDTTMLPALKRKLPLTEPMSEEQVEKIDTASMAILEEVGVVFRDEIALEDWRKAGADVRGETVHFDRGLIRELIKTIPSSFTYHARNPANNLPFGNDHLIFVPMTGAPYLRDLDDVRRISGVGGDRIVVRNRFTYDPSMEVSCARIENVARDHDRAFAARFPMLAEVAMAYRWGGRLCFSRNNVAVMGEVDNGLFTACCQNGLGTAKGTHNGAMVAELAAGKTSQMPDQALAAAAPQKLLPTPLAYIGANAFIKWQEFKAGAEL